MSEFSFIDRRANNDELLHEVVHLSSQAFKQATLKEQNPYGVGTFATISALPPHKVTVYVDNDLFTNPYPDNPDQDFRSVEPVAIQHELYESYKVLIDMLGGAGLGMGQHIDTTHDTCARKEALRLAKDLRVTETYLDFIKHIQLVADLRYNEAYGINKYDGIHLSPDGLRALEKVVDLAFKVEQESTVSGE